MHRLGIVNFINTAPLLIPFLEMGALDQWEIEEGSPAMLNRKLKAGQIHAGLISSFSYGQHFKDYFLLGDYCISATGTVGSVLLFSRKPIYDLFSSRIVLTNQSETSINLLFIILEYFNGFQPRYVSGTFHDFESDSQADAYLAIGDEALRLNRARGNFFTYDLASIWYETTSLPFVFAVWAVRKDSGLRDSPALEILKARLDQSYQKGAMRLDEIAGKVCSRIPMPQGECLSYLKGIEYDLSSLKIRGLTNFFRLLMQMGKIAAIPEVIEI
ncbi:MAG: ABC transporter substrate-binding protein [Thermodesulfatator sp.]|nr:MAG: ABC transporter substrate-binding protein [Thermodesulfatator sp.]